MTRSAARKTRGGLGLACVCGLGLACAWMYAGSPAPQSGPADAEAPAFSPAALVVDGNGHVFVAGPTSGGVAVVCLDGSQATRMLPVAGVPLAMAVNLDGSLLYVADGNASGRVVAMHSADGKVVGEAAVGHTPTALALSGDGKTLYVANRFTDDVSVVDALAMKELVRVPVLRQPVAMALTPDDGLLVVANHLPAGRADGGDLSAAVSIVSIADRKAQHIRLLNGSTSLRGVCISPDGKYAYVTHILARYLMPTSQVERGWMNTNAVSIIDLAARQLLACVLVDDLDRGAANPWALACTGDGRYLLVTHAGTHELSVIDRPGMHKKIEATLAAQVAHAKAATGPAATRPTGPAVRTLTPIEDDLAFLVGLRKRVPLPGQGPRALAIIGDKAVVAMHYSDSLAIADIPSAAAASSQPSARLAPVKAVAVGLAGRMSPSRRGEMLFNDAGACFQGWQSCATCHPDGRSDGLNWDLLNDGLGNPRQTKSMLLAHRTPPAMITGVRPDAETAVRAGFSFIQFVSRPPEDAQAIDEYLKSLQPVPSPHRPNGQLGESAQRGVKVFQKAHCDQCHSGPLFTDGRKHLVGTAYPFESSQPFVTPTLVEVWRTAPYLMDGRAATIMEVLTTHNQGDKHGMTSGLTEQERKDLAEFVLSQ